MRAFWLLSALCVAVWALATADRLSGLSVWFELREERRASDERISQLQLEVESLRAEVAAFEDDPLAMERAIREVLEFARPGETVVRFVKRDAGAISRLN